MPHRRSGRRLAGPVLAVLLTLSAVAGCADQTPAEETETDSSPIGPLFFGMHEGRIAQGVFPEAPVGAVRFWDSGTTWRHTEVAPGQYNWAPLDKAVATAEEHGARPLHVLALTPTFHASRPEEEAAYGPGAASMPDVEAWRRYVAAVAERYGDRIDYQVWNEGNVSNYWSGTPAQLAELTIIASEAIRAVEPEATLVAPSFALRLPSQREYFAEFWGQQSEEVDLAGAVDVVGVHLYPEATGLPEDQLELLEEAREVLADNGVDKPLWNAEINYGLLGGAEPPTIPEERQRAFLMRTYLLNAGAGIDRVYWYRWDLIPIANTLLTEEDRSTPTLAGRAYETVRDWLEGTTVEGCESTDGVWECTAEVDDETRTFWWVQDGEDATMHAPAGSSWTDADGRTTPCEDGCEVPVGETPVMVRS